MDNAQLLQSIEQMFANMNTQFTRQLATVQETLTGQVEELRQEVSGQIDGLHREIAGVQGQVTSLQQEVASLQQEVAGVKSEVAGVKSEVAGIKGEVAGIKGEVAGLRLDIAKLNETVQDNHAYTVSELSKVAKEVENKVVDKIQGNVASLREEVNLFEKHVVDYSIDVNVVKSKIQYCACIDEGLARARAENAPKI